MWLCGLEPRPLNRRVAAIPVRPNRGNRPMFLSHFMLLSLSQVNFKKPSGEDQEETNGRLDPAFPGESPLISNPDRQFLTGWSRRQSEWHPLHSVQSDLSLTDSGHRAAATFPPLLCPPRQRPRADTPTQPRTRPAETKQQTQMPEFEEWLRVKRATAATSTEHVTRPHRTPRFSLRPSPQARPDGPFSVGRHRRGRARAASD